MNEPGVIRTAAPCAGQLSPGPGIGRRLLRWLARMPTRTFLIYPLVVIAFEAATQ
jgi:hypothetical protein